VSGRGDEAIERVHDLTEHGAHSVLEFVGLEQAVTTALAIARPGGAIGASASPSTKRRHPALRSGNTLRSGADRRRCARTSTSSYRTFSKADRPGPSSTAPARSRRAGRDCAMNNREVLKLQIKS
jgi:hypothetical protein